VPEKKIKKNKKEKTQNNNIRIIVTILILLSVVTLVVYFPAFQNNFLNWDDNYVVTGNNSIHSITFDNIKHIFSTTSLNSYNPIVILSFALEYHFSGLNPKIFHSVNIVFHVLNTLLVFFLFYKIGKNYLIAGFTALLFSIHPMHIEAVAWVTSRKEVLYSFFYLCSIISYLYYKELQTENNKNKNLKYYIISVLLFILSVLSKPVAVTLTPVLILIDYLQEGKFSLKQIYNKIPFIIISVGFSLVTYLTFSLGRAVGSTSNIMTSILVFFYSIVFYLQKLVLPVGLSPVYPFPSDSSLPLIYYVSPIIILVLISAIYKYFRHDKYIIFAFLFFIVTILPVTQLIPVKNTSIVFDRFTYIPYLGFFFMLGYYFNGLYTRKILNAQNGRTAIIFFTVLVFIIFSYLSYTRAGVWNNDVSLWTDSIEKYPESPIGYFNRGEYYYRLKDYNKAIGDYTQSIKIDSSNTDFFNNRGMAYRDAGDYDKAVYDFHKALEKKEKNTSAYNNLGILYTYKKDVQNANVNFDKALEINPDYPDVYANIGNLYFTQQKYDSAIANYNKAISINPDFTNGYFSRGLSNLRLGKYEDAVNDFKKAETLDPAFADAYSQEAYAYFLSKNYDKSWEVVHKIRELQFQVDSKFLEMLIKGSGRQF